MTASLELQTTVSGETPVASGSLTSFLGEATTYSVTVPPDAADAIEHGDRTVAEPGRPAHDPGPASPSSSPQEFYAGHDMEASYRALQLELGYEEGTRVSAGVSRVDPSTVRIYVGDEDFVRNALSLGVGNDAAGVALAAGAELSDGKLHSVDIDISTAAGWKAYQQFLKSGKLPREGAPGTSDPTKSDVFEFTDATQLEAHVGNLSIGGVLAESGATGVETTNADGSVDGTFVAHFNDAGVAVTTHTEPGGEPEPTRYSLLLENVSDDTIGTYEHVTGQPLAHGDGQPGPPRLHPGRLRRDPGAGVRPAPVAARAEPHRPQRGRAARHHGGVPPRRRPLRDRLGVQQRLRAGRRRDPRAGALRALPRLRRRAATATSACSR